MGLDLELGILVMGFMGFVNNPLTWDWRVFVMELVAILWEFQPVLKVKC
jgi:hypothetical protein